jgi:hypothetical protein
LTVIKSSVTHRLQPSVSIPPPSGIETPGCELYSSLILLYSALDRCHLKGSDTRVSRSKFHLNSLAAPLKLPPQPAWSSFFYQGLSNYQVGVPSNTFPGSIWIDNHSIFRSPTSTIEMPVWQLRFINSSFSTFLRIYSSAPTFLTYVTLLHIYLHLIVLHNSIQLR